MIDKTLSANAEGKRNAISSIITLVHLKNHEGFLSKIIVKL